MGILKGRGSIFLFGRPKKSSGIFGAGKHSQMLHGAGIFTYIYPKNNQKYSPNVDKYSIDGASGIGTCK